MTRFPTARHLASWAGLCPGNHESAGRRKGGRTRDGNRWLCQMLVQCAWAAARTKRSYFHQQYHRLKARRGHKRALIAVAHAILTTIWHLLHRGSDYDDPGHTHSHAPAGGGPPAGLQPPAAPQRAGLPDPRGVRGVVPEEEEEEGMP